MKDSAIWSVALVLAVLTGGCGEGPNTSGPSQETTPVLEKEITVDLGGGVTMELVLIPAGEFMMGDGSGQSFPDQQPLHKVKITRLFYLGKYEVTQRQWEAVMGNNPSEFRGPENPVDQVSRDDCQAFPAKLNQKSGKGGVKLNLPTEAQWEYACRAGTTTRYSFGDDLESLGDYAWHTGNSGKTTHPVGQKKPNSWGLYDMHGNVWEYCSDWYGEDYYRQSPLTDPTGPASGDRHVLRGGSFDHDRVSRQRYWCIFRNNRDHRRIKRGFRVASAPVDESAR